jgi:tRNA dimethylallyltransferase
MPLLVGGTLLYLRAFRGGLAKLPSADPIVRGRIDAAAAKRGWSALHERLTQIDPDAGRRIAPTDRQRIQRALEVYELTGEVISTHQNRADENSGAVRVRTLALMENDRDALAQRIEARFDAMVVAGLIDEVRALVARGDLTPDLPAMRAVGYRQIRAYLEGSYDWPEARRRSITATRQLAKRQMTWLRSEQNLLTLQWSNPSRIQAALEWALAARRQA